MYWFYKNPRYTVGTTTGSSWVKGKQVKYIFKVNGKLYKGSMGDSHKAKVKNGRYFVRFSETYPEINRIYFSKPVPGYIKDIPPNGWKKIPTRLDIYP